MKTLFTPKNLNIIIYFCFIIFLLYLITSVHIVNCEDFKNLAKFIERQHSNRVGIILDVITNCDQKDILIAINKCVKAKVALLNPELIITNDLDFTPLTKLPENFGQGFKRFMFFIFWVFLSLIFDGSITFGVYLFNDVSLLQEQILLNFSQITSDYKLIEELYEVLVNTEIITD